MRRTSRLLALGAAGMLGLVVGNVTAGSGGGGQPERDGGQQPGGMEGMPEEMRKEMEAWQKAGRITERHKELQKMAGEWEARGWFQWDPNMPKEEAEADAEVESILGGRYTVMRFDSEMMGMPHEGMAVMGYDNIKEKYVSIWMDNMSTSPMMSYGTRQDNTITFECEYENPMGEMEQMVVESTLSGEDRMVDRFYEMRDGKKIQTGEFVYERVSGGGDEMGMGDK